MCDGIGVLLNKVSDVLTLARCVKRGQNAMNQDGIRLRNVGELF